MAAITSSFALDIAQNVCDEVLRLCGTGEDAYAEPDYLQLQVARPGMVLPTFDIQKASEIPYFLMQYVYSDALPGGQVGGETHRHIFNAGAFMQLTPSIVGLVSPTATEFYECALASADVFLRRIRRVLISYAPSVQDSTFHEASNIVTIYRWRPWIYRVNDMAYDVTLLFEYHITGELDEVFGF